MDSLRRLGDRLDVIEATLSVALQEPEPEHRGRMLDMLDRAAAVVRAEHEEAEAAQKKRSSFRLICGSIPRQGRHLQRPTQANAVPAERWQDQTRDPAERSAG